MSLFVLKNLNGVVTSDIELGILLFVVHSLVKFVTLERLEFLTIFAKFCFWENCKLVFFDSYFCEFIFLFIKSFSVKHVSFIWNWLLNPLPIIKSSSRLLSLICLAIITFDNTYRPDAGLYHLPFTKILNEEKIIVGRI